MRRAEIADTELKRFLQIFYFPIVLGQKEAFGNKNNRELCSWVPSGVRRPPASTPGWLSEPSLPREGRLGARVFLGH